MTPTPANPLDAPTIGAALLAAAHRDESAFVVHLRDDTRRLGLRELRDLAAARRAALHRHDIAPGDRVGLIGPTHIEFIAWSYAVWLAGATLVPLPSPMRVRDAEALRDQTLALSRAFDCRLVIAHPRFVTYGPAGVTVPWDDIEPGDATPDDAGTCGPDDLAVVLCTSGSTALPKGVAMSHRRVLGREKSIAKMFDRKQQASTRLLYFQPLSHAAGFAAMMSVLLPGVETHIMAPELFARDPAEWLRLTTRIEATLISGPSSVWAAALKAAQRRPEGIDLSHLRSACLSMEMIDPDVVDQLIDVGGRFGLRPDAIMAMYGLSEGGATTTELGQGIHIDHVDLDALASEGLAVPVEPGAGRTKRVAGCGRPAASVDLRVMGPGGPLPDRHVGEIQFRGPGTIDRYVGPAAEDVLVDGWMRTGDLGYLVDGELFVTGRVKEVIVHRGRNYHPEDVERAAGRAAGVAVDSCVAFSPSVAGEGDLVIAIEVDGHDEELEDRVRAAVTNSIGLVPSDIIFVSRGSLPKAANGKAQRVAARDRHARGDLISLPGRHDHDGPVGDERLE